MAIKMSKKKTKVKKIKKKIILTKRASKSSRAVSTNLAYPTGEYIEAVGRRKTATARVRLYESKGDFIVNDKVVGQYFANVTNAPKIYNQPFALTKTVGKFSATIKVSGSGIQGQVEAVRHGITRALVKFNPEFKSLLKAESLLTRDDRMKETRKIGMGGKARRKRQSPKR